MAQFTREIKRRIRSIKNTKQITKAMELVSASKMRRAQQKTMATRAYARRAWDVLQHLAIQQSERQHPLLEKRPVQSVCVVLFTSNRGLAGGFNAHVIRQVAQMVRQPEQLLTVGLEAGTEPAKMNIDFITIGRKGEAAVRKMGKKIIAAFPEISDTPNVEEMMPLARIVIEEYTARNYDMVVLAYTDFISAIVQEPKFHRVLPLMRETAKVQVDDVGDTAVRKELENIPYTFEPSPTEVLDRVLRSLTQVQLYQALLESRASEHASRMMAMRNASDSADEMMGDLTLSFNQARQAGITKEIAEIAAGSAALH